MVCVCVCHEVLNMLMDIQIRLLLEHRLTGCSKTRTRDSGVTEQSCPMAMFRADYTSPDIHTHKVQGNFAF